MTTFVTLSASALEGRGNSPDFFSVGYCKVERDGITYVARGRDLKAFRKSYNGAEGEVRLPEIYRFVKYVNGRQACFVTLGEKRASEILGEFLHFGETTSYKKAPGKRRKSVTEKHMEIEPYDRGEVQRIKDYIKRTSKTGDLVQINIEWDYMSKSFVAKRRDYEMMRQNSAGIGEQSAPDTINPNGNGLPEIFSFIGYDFDSDTAKIGLAKLRSEAWKLALSDRADV